MHASDRPLRRRLMELGISSLHNTKIARHKNGYIVKVRNATYVIGKDGARVMREIIDNEGR